jgi:23S rRNA (adenine2503-C2)-methyltransferase
VKILAKTGREGLATVYVAETQSGKRIEFVESLQSPLPREKKWVLIISSLFGCCVGCVFCDAGGNYQGKLSKDELFDQIDYLISKRYPDREVPVEKLKIQFARMGEPALNMNVIDVLQEFPDRYNAPGFMPSVSTIAPAGTDKFFDRLLQVKKELYRENFQLQFSIHTTDQQLRDRIIPVKKWDFSAIADYGQDFYEKYEKGHRKITLNFALADDYPLEPAILLKYFTPERFLIKITPVNPSYKAVTQGLSSEELLSNRKGTLISALKHAGYEVILSIGELEENRIGSNCGQYLENYEKEKQALEKSYNYQLQPV